MTDLTVAMNGLVVGRLGKSPSGELTFEYSDEWLSRAGTRPVSLSLPLDLRRYRGAEVYHFFDNLLPDSDLIRRRIQARYRVAADHPYDLLSAVGRDCVGALQLYPDAEVMPNVQQISAKPISDAGIAALLRDYLAAPLGMDQSSDFRISLAGAQEKTALLWWRGGWHRPLGSTPTSHILKLPTGLLVTRNIDLSQSCENEWLCLKLAQALGLPVAQAELGQFDSEQALVVERFDRRWSKDHSWLMRLPQEDLCQALGVSPALKYENDGGPGVIECMRLLSGSQQPLRDRLLFFKAQVVFWALAALDGHAKNFSVFLEPFGAFQMTPLYDIISAFPLMAQGSLPAQRVKMAMSVKGKKRHYHWARIEPRHFLSTAKTAGLGVTQAEAVLHEVAIEAPRAVEAVQSMLPDGFPGSVSEPIFAGVLAQAQALRGH